MDIYKSLLDEDDEGNRRIKREADLNLSGEEQKKIDQSDVIITFESISKCLISAPKKKKCIILTMKLN